MVAKSIAKHLDGWQGGVIALLLAGSAVVLSVPRAAPPARAPAPRIDAARLTATMRRDDELARAALKAPLDVDVRAVGRELRRYNREARGGDEEAFATARERVAAAARKAAPVAAQLEMLRAYQLARFLDELDAWRRTGVESDELAALSGDFLATAARNRWCRSDTRELWPGERELRVLFKKRWNSIVGVEDGSALALTPDEERVRLGFVIAHPFVANDRATGSLDGAAAARIALGPSLRAIDELAALDRDYPADLARGVMLYRAGQYERAAAAFRRQLETRSDGAYALLARNELKAALDRAAGE